VDSVTQVLSIEIPIKNPEFSIFQPIVFTYCSTYVLKIFLKNRTSFLILCPTKNNLFYLADIKGSTPCVGDVPFYISDFFGHIFKIKNKVERSKRWSEAEHPSLENCIAKSFNWKVDKIIIKIFRKSFKSRRIIIWNCFHFKFFYKIFQFAFST